MGSLVTHVEQTIQSRELLSDGQTILVAVSGGVDSMVLLHVLSKLSPAHGWRLVAVHFNHQLRGQESDGDELLVQQTAASLGLPFWPGRGDVRRFQTEHRCSLEMAARKLRHEFFVAAALEFQAPTIALAHHADDQLELFFLRLLRGAGGQGLGGMKWRNRSPSDPRLWLVRPLLDQSKQVLRSYAQACVIAFREDSSNVHRQPLRNRVRHELLPLLISQYQPALGRSVLRLMEMVASDAELAHHLAAAWLESSGRQRFAELHTAVQRQVVRAQLLRLGEEATFDLVEQLRQAAGVPITTRTGWSMVRDETGQVHRSRTQPIEFDADKLDIVFNGNEGDLVFASVQLHWQLGGNAGEIGKHPGQEVFDADKVGSRARLRHWQPGDRFQPIGLAAPAKLQNLFTNGKIPRRQRHQLVLAQGSSGEIFWVEGLRLAEHFKLDSHTTRYLTWNWHRM